MKKCPFCAEEIQDEAILCRFCQKPQPPLRPARSPEYLAAQKATNRKLLIGLLSLLGVFGVAAIVGVLTSDSRRQATSPARAKPTTVLDVSAGKGVTGLSVTNREAFAISDCQLTALERGRSDEFVAIVKAVSPMETVRVSWSEFKAPAGQPMPAYIGQAAKHFTFTCGSTKDQRQGAGFAF